MSSNSNRTQYIAKGGLFTAVGIILVYISGIIPINKTCLLAAASFIIPLSIITTNVRNTLAVYVATSLLSLLLCGIKMTVLAYILFFGLYGIVKFYIEKIQKIIVEIILKLAFLNICTVILLLIYRLFFPGIFNFRFSMHWIILGLQIVFLLYDYLLTLIINFINKRLYRKNLY